MCLDMMIQLTERTKDNLPKGCTISYKKPGEDKLSYLYPKLLLSYDESMEWIQEHIKTGIEYSRN